MKKWLEEQGYYIIYYKLYRLTTKKRLEGYSYNLIFAYLDKFAMLKKCGYFSLINITYNINILQ